MTGKRIVAAMGLDRKLRCSHEFIEVATGSMHFDRGDIWDDIEIKDVCKYCGEEMRKEEPIEISEAIPV